MNTKNITAMTFRSKLPLHLAQKYFLIKDLIESFFRKIEVIIDSNAIIYSIRILIVLLALLMGYLHTPKSKADLSNAAKSEISVKGMNSPMEKIK